MLFTIKDEKSGLCGAICEAETVEEMERQIKILLSSPQKSLMKMYPSDFSLYFLGEFDRHTGVIVPSTPSLVSNLIKYVEVTNASLIGDEDLHQITIDEALSTQDSLGAD